MLVILSEAAPNSAGSNLLLTCWAHGIPHANTVTAPADAALVLGMCMGGEAPRACGRTARKVLEGGQTVSKASVAGSLLAAVRLNLWGLGATLLGLQAGRAWIPDLLQALAPGVKLTHDVVTDI